ncbi:hypothetical protein ACU686_36990 [Yinghuangia aomiensis]
MVYDTSCPSPRTATSHASRSRDRRPRPRQAAHRRPAPRSRPTAQGRQHDRLPPSATALFAHRLLHQPGHPRRRTPLVPASTTRAQFFDVKNPAEAGDRGLLRAGPYSTETETGRPPTVRSRLGDGQPDARRLRRMGPQHRVGAHQPRHL